MRISNFQNFKQFKISWNYDWKLPKSKEGKWYPDIESRVWNKMNPVTHTKHVTKMSNVKERILKAARKKKGITYKRTI